VESSGTVTAAPLESDPFASEAAKRFGVPVEKTLKLRQKGFGKTELLTFLAVAKASPKSWEQLVEEREKGRALRKMAEEAGLDPDALFDRSSALKKEIEKGIETPPPEK
jgi:hypothetical protein